MNEDGGSLLAFVLSPLSQLPSPLAKETVVNRKNRLKSDEKRNVVQLLTNTTNGQQDTKILH